MYQDTVFNTADNSKTNKIVHTLLLRNIPLNVSDKDRYAHNQDTKQPWMLFFVVFFVCFYLFLAVLGLRFCARAFCSCGKRGPLFIAVREPLTIAASLVVEHRLQTRVLSSCGSRATELRGMWDLPKPGLEPVFPTLAGRFSTAAPPGNPGCCIFFEKAQDCYFKENT